MTHVDPSDRNIYTVGWICAIEPENVAAQIFLDEEYPKLPSRAHNDNNIYTTGRIGPHNVVIATLPERSYGTTPVAIVAGDLMRTFPNIRIGLMVGVAGGAPSAEHDVRLGDVVVSCRGGGEGAGGDVIAYDVGKALHDEDGDRFAITGHLNKPPLLTQAALTRLKHRSVRKGYQIDDKVARALEGEKKAVRQKYSRPPAETDKLFRSDFLHPSPEEQCKGTCDKEVGNVVARPVRDEDEDEVLVVHYGPIASGNTLVKNSTLREELRRKGVLCFETEAAGLKDHFPCLVIRGICDYADSHKNKEWQGFASMAAAAYAKDILLEIPPEEVQSAQKLSADLKAVGEQVHKLTETMETFGDDAQRRGIETWLSPPEHYSNLRRARGLRHAGSSTWFMEGGPFKEWVAGTNQSIWLHGLTGCGKTILSSTVIDHLMNTQEHQHGKVDILAYFFDFNDKRKRNVENLLRSLVFQLYTLNPSTAVGAYLTDVHQQSTKANTSASSVDFKEILVSMINMSSQKRIFIILDALDECDERDELVGWLQALLNTTEQSTCHMLVTSRPEAVFLESLPLLFGLDMCMEIDRAAVDVDIMAYVHARLATDRKLRNLTKCSQDLQEQVRCRIGGQAQGMFRWAACQLDALAECHSPLQVKEALDHLPKTLDALHQRMLDSIPQTLRPDSIRLLQFLVHHGPLRVTEAIDVIATQLDEEPTGLNPEARLFNEASLLEYCAGMAFIVDFDPNGGDDDDDGFDSDSYYEKDDYDEGYEFCNWNHPFGFKGAGRDLMGEHTNARELRVVHFSVKEYLLQREEFQLLPSCAALAATMLNYIRSVEAFLAQNPQNHRDYIRSAAAKYFWGRPPTKVWALGHPLWRRSVRHWAGHARQLEENKSYEPLTSLILGVFAFNPRLEGQNRVISPGLVFRESATVGTSRPSALYLAAVLGLSQTISALISSGAEVEPAPYNYNSSCISGPLAIASYKGRMSAVSVLLAGGASVSPTPPQANGMFRSRSALYLACNRGHSEIVHMLLHHGAAADAGSNNGYSPLEFAVQRCDTEVARLLLKSGADLDLQVHDHDGRTLLDNAVRRFSLPMTRLLLAYGAKVDARTDTRRTVSATALHTAAGCLQHDSFEHFLHCGDGSDDPSCHTAMPSMHIEVIKVLLAHGADVNAPWDSAYPTTGYLLSDGRSALDFAAESGSLEVVTLLIAHGADVNGRAKAYGKPLYYAASGRFLRIVDKLLAHGADADAQVEDLTNPLHAAFENGHVEIVQRLGAAGASVGACGWPYLPPLHAAIERLQPFPLSRRETLCMYLVKHGAVTNEHGGDKYELVFNRAIHHNMPRLAELLLQNGAGAETPGHHLQLEYCRHVSEFLQPPWKADPVHIGQCVSIWYDNKLDARGVPLDHGLPVEFTRDLDEDTDSDIGMLSRMKTRQLAVLSTPLYEAVAVLNAVIVRLLLKYGASVNKVGGIAGTPLQLVYSMKENCARQMHRGSENSAKTERRRQDQERIEEILKLLEDAAA